ncbi:hypothetical protein SmaMPs15_000039 [Stenotrophomonas maltophilia phage vB_SmaM_Ps15]|uniref:Uncharacterized protein n=1 Tax=Stenotrophomonas maltophilia phage vB_SmaM_Ps15 TaxID=3071007 RepID=A0AAE9JUY3_9CAUD|nr:hypothetical protein PQC01_gp039 [Stenotrophomonas maltophilia phage vB_SmaM_Ps15]UMO77190.1 hypothetical protein SmaMPs15_000039 [Stenotrophomonas maltophilia phage vB_SmaM_Ps15]
MYKIRVDTKGAALLQVLTSGIRFDAGVTTLTEEQRYFAVNNLNAFCRQKVWSYENKESAIRLVNRLKELPMDEIMYPGKEHSLL